MDQTDEIGRPDEIEGKDRTDGIDQTDGTDEIDETDQCAPVTNCDGTEGGLAPEGAPLTSTVFRACPNRIQARAPASRWRASAAAPG